MNAGIYDTEHFETAYTLIKILDTSCNKITIFTLTDLAPILKKMMGNDGADYNWVLLKRNKLINSYIIYKHCRVNKIDHLFLNTVSQHHILFGILCVILKKARTVLTIHDANSFFKPTYKMTLRSVLQYVGKKLLVKKVTVFATLLSSTKQYIQETFKPKQRVVCIPGSFFETESYPVQHASSTLKIVIPGSVDLRRRNYNFILELLPHLNTKNRIEIVLLGGVERNNKILTQFKAFNSAMVKIKTYDQLFVDTEEYEKQIRTCDFILAPIQKFFQGESITPEEYGLSKSSGSFFDAVRFGKPLIVSADIMIPKEIQKQCIRYHSVYELAAFFEGVNSDNKLQYNKMALSNALNFTLENIRKRLPLFFDNQ
jgi:hypothetical protein